MHLVTRSILPGCVMFPKYECFWSLTTSEPCISQPTLVCVRHSLGLRRNGFWRRFTTELGLYSNCKLLGGELLLLALILMRGKAVCSAQRKSQRFFRLSRQHGWKGFRSKARFLLIPFFT